MKGEKLVAIISQATSIGTSLHVSNLRNITEAIPNCFQILKKGR